MAIISINFALNFSCRDKTADVKKSINNYKEMVCSSDAYYQSSKFLVKGGEEKKFLSLCDDFQFKNSMTVENILCKSEDKKRWETFEFNLLESKSKGPSSAPVVQITYNKVNFLCSNFKGKAILYVFKHLSLTELPSQMSKAVAQHLQLAEYWFIKQLKDHQLLSPLVTYPVKHYLVSHIMIPIYPKDCHEDLLQNYR